MGVALICLCVFHQSIAYCTKTHHVDVFDDDFVLSSNHLFDNSLLSSVRAAEDVDFITLEDMPSLDFIDRLLFLRQPSQSERDSGHSLHPSTDG